MIFDNGSVAAGPRLTAPGGAFGTTGIRRAPGQAREP
jgi:hypothetical protein